MNRRAGLLATGALVALTLPLASPAQAARPERGCPPPFELLTYAEQVALAQELGVPLSVVDETVARIDKNGDTSLCFAFQNKVKGAPNVIDNTASSPSSR
jgi:hypothetical protein